MIRRPLLALLFALPAAGCAAGIHSGIADLRPIEAPVHADRIALLPVTAEPGSEPYRRTIAESLTEAAQTAHPGIDWIPADESLRLLNNAGLAERFATMLLAHQQTGIWDAALLREVGAALGADHVLQVRVGYHVSEELRPRFLSSTEVYSSETQALDVSVLLWDVRDGGLSWEASGGSESTEGEFTTRRRFDEVLAATAASLAESLPVVARDDALDGGPAADEVASAP